MVVERVGERSITAEGKWSLVRREPMSEGKKNDRVLINCSSQERRVQRPTVYTYYKPDRSARLPPEVFSGQWSTSKTSVDGVVLTRQGVFRPNILALLWGVP